MSARRAKINPEAPLSIRRRCELLTLNRSTAYYEPVSTPAEDLAMMRLIDELYTARPIYGSRKMAERLRERGHEINRKRVQRLMRLMDLVGLQPRRSTSRAHPDTEATRPRAEHSLTRPLPWSRDGVHLF